MAPPKRGGTKAYPVEIEKQARGARGGARESSDVDFGALRLSVAFNDDSLANDRKIAERAAANGAEGVG